MKGDRDRREKIKQLEAGDGAGALDEYLFACGEDCRQVDWERLKPVAQRVLIRLVVDVQALSAHFRRLEEDGNRFMSSPDSVNTASLYTLWGHDPQDQRISIFDYCALLRDACRLALLAHLVRDVTHSAWKSEFAEPRPPFSPGDRDDRAAARLYQLLKMLPPLDVSPDEG